MNFERIINRNIFRKIRQLESFSKTNIFSNCSKPAQIARTSTTLSGINQCSNSSTITNGNSRFLAKFPSSIGLQQSRNVATPAGDHVRLWVFEKAVTVALPIAFPLAFIMENAVFDGLLSTLVVMHFHWGLEAIITDYARPKVVGPLLPKVLHGSLILLSVATLAGLFVLIHNGPGVATSIKNFWAIGKEKSSK